MVASAFDVGASVEYACDAGHLLVGPTVRTCLDTGFYDEFPPICKRECQLQPQNKDIFGTEAKLLGNCQNYTIRCHSVYLFPPCLS